ncbi:MAG TPA: glycosyltransferase family 2 protein [Pyrinomonadaceae bacterium]|nr:glycosyltransferase family 2 protein [Pyrinomonadaceae bacterium]
MEAIFWLSVAAIGYAYVGYPVLLIVLSRLRPKPVKSGHWTPSVTVIIAAYNEERDLAAKLENTLALDYPPSQLEIIVTSDCSSDRTDEIARSFAARGVRLHRQEERHGKTAAQNAAVTKARGEIIVFSDATTHYRPDVLRLMIPAFADSSVGCVTGRVIYQDDKDSNVGSGTQSYWNYEFFLKKHESAVCSLIGVCGCMYAVRASAYIPLYNEACSDFIIATTMVEQGLRAVYVPEAVCTEEPNRQAKRELAARVRIISQTFSDLWRNRAVLNPFRSGFYAVQLWSHKLMRYLVPVFLIAIFFASAFLATRNAFYAAVFVMQVAFYLAALVSWMLEKLGVTSGLLALPQYFVITNLASLIAFVKFLTGERYTRWEPSRE